MLGDENEKRKVGRTDAQVAWDCGPDGSIKSSCDRYATLVPIWTWQCGERARGLCIPHCSTRRSSGTKLLGQASKNCECESDCMLDASVESVRQMGNYKGIGDWKRE